jgi:ribosomal protein S18 acetylase RimI-like enzyme
LTGDTTPSIHGQITLRASTGEDEPFLREVYASTRADELALVGWSGGQKAAFLDMQFRAQHTYYHEQMPDGAYDIILEDGVAVGRLYVDYRPDDIHIVDIALLPQHRNRGIGAHLIRQIMKGAAANSQSVSLYVELFNRARRFYDRLGFREVRTEGIYLLTKWRADDGVADKSNHVSK